MTATDGLRDVIIVGSGPAGLTAAIYTARANLHPLVIEGEPSSTSDQPGGQLMLTTEVENFPGFPTGIMGPELMANMREQAIRFGAEFITDKVTRVELSRTGGAHRVWVRDVEHAGRVVIASTGARSVMLGLPEEQRLIGHGLSTCATCDGFFFRDQHIVVVGGGDSAIEEALFLTKFAAKVTVVHRRDQLRASKIMADRAFANDRIEFAWNSQVTAIVGKDRDSRNRLSGTVEPPAPGDIEDLPAEGTPEHARCKEAGLAALSRGEVALCVLAGGMATRMGGVVKALVEALPGHTFLDLRLAESDHLERLAGAPVPLWLMTSEATERPTREALGPRLRRPDRTPIPVPAYSPNRAPSEGNAASWDRPRTCAAAG